jgi:hypothetical protein
MFYQKQLKIFKWPQMTNVGRQYWDCTNICLFCCAAMNTLHSKQQKKYKAIQHTSMQSQSWFHMHPPNDAVTHGLSSCSKRGRGAEVIHFNDPDNCQDLYNVVGRWMKYEYQAYIQYTW